uniref:Granulins domain-containing protein n=1 Tax=Periophthalmus magnuspinnatus TaxID=409849 RepID=A0A3B4A3C3_9GOBI
MQPLLAPAASFFTLLFNNFTSSSLNLFPLDLNFNSHIILSFLPSKNISCKDEETCCSAGEGSWFCCPAPNAVCCTDHQHCCPAGYQCDLTISNPDSNSKDVQCEDKSSCPDHNTCCQTLGGPLVASGL